ncbi:MAG: thiamine phosphate synthase [Gammaproteobacteria bacterium]|nr:thiamine phosphate synthase [Gammaproteobacteria bacterium]
MPAGILPDGLYAITDSRLTPHSSLLERVEQAIAGGARVIQYRDKLASDGERYTLAIALAALCLRRQVPLIINDDAALAAAVGANGVHLGEADGTVAAARAQLGAEAMIGVSCYNSMERAREAAAQGASYVAFGRFFASRSKPDAVSAGTDLLCTARRELDVPVAAIGGISPDNAGPLIAAGANLLAVIHGVFGQEDVVAAAASYAHHFPAAN